jgi:hypothetical protein
MRQLLIGLVATSVMDAPVQAAGQRPDDIRPGAFVGARLKLSLGGREAAKPRAELAFAPTQSRISGDGMVRTRIGEGLALNLTGERKPMLTLGGVRADSALGLQRNGSVKIDQKAGISTGGWIAIGVGTAVIAGAVAFALWVDAVNDSSD